MDKDDIMKELGIEDHIKPHDIFIEQIQYKNTNTKNKEELADHLVN